MNRNTIVSFVVGLVAGALGYKFIGASLMGVRMLGPRRRLGVQEYVGLTDWDTEQKALALTRSLEGVMRLGDVPSSAYDSMTPPSFEGAPDFLDVYDPDGPKYPDFLFRGPKFAPHRGPA
jgi:hypothetical protein